MSPYPIVISLGTGYLTAIATALGGGGWRSSLVLATAAGAVGYSTSVLAPIVCGAASSRVNACFEKVKNKADEARDRLPPVREWLGTVYQQGRHISPYQLVASLGTGYLAAIGAILLEGGVRPCLGFFAAGTAVGYGAIVLTPIACQATISATNAGLDKAYQKLEETIGPENMPPPGQVLEFVAVLLMSFWAAYEGLDAGFINAAPMAVGGLVLWACIRNEFLPNGGISSYLPHPYFTSPEAKLVPLSADELKDFDIRRGDISNPDTIAKLQTTTRGIANGGNDCFFNAGLQIIIHSPLLPLMLEALGKQYDAGEKKGDTEVECFYVRFINLLDAYLNKTEACPPPTNMRGCLPKLSEGGPEDPEETLARISHLCEVEENGERKNLWNEKLGWQTLTTCTLKVGDQDTIAPMQATVEEEKASAIKQGNILQRYSHKEWYVLLSNPTPSTSITLQQLFDHWLAEDNDPGRSEKYTKESDSAPRSEYTADVVKEEVTIEHLPDSLFCRFKGESCQNQRTVVKSLKMTTDSTDVTVGEQKYSLKGFAKYTDSGWGGHYLAYRKIDDQWHCLDDSTVTQIDENAALQAFSGASFAYFSKATEQ